MKPKIVYVDDELANRVVFEATFEDDYDIHCAGSGEEALQLLDRTGAPIFVADQRMPGMSGVELCEIVQRQHPHTKRILLTGYSDYAAMLDAINKGRVFHFLTKPWDRHALHAVLRQALEAYELCLVNTALTERLLSAQRFAALGKAAAEIAHEMGNQMALLPLIEVIEERYAEDEEFVEMAHLARATAERLAALIEEIKAFVRCDTTQLSMRPLDLADAVHELISFLRFDRTIPCERLTLRLAAGPTVAASKAKLQQVLVNLLKNAADAIRDRADGRIVLGLDREAGQAVVTVADNGCGMTRETLAHLWKPFFTTKGGKGTGLGLDIARQIVESHGGTIGCHSEPQQGTTFTIRLPLLEPEEAAAHPVPQIVGDPSAVPCAGR